MINNIYKKQLNNLTQRILHLEKIYKALPDGSLSIGHSDGCYKWFHSYNHQCHYIKKNDVELAKKLAVKKYLELKIQLLKNQKSLMDTNARRIYPAQQKLDKLLNDAGYMDLLSDYMCNFSEESSIWMKEDYPKNTSYPEALVHQTVGGIMVRSKSESMIAISLAENGIPFRYENLLEIDGITVAPDFTIMHPITGKIFYWEHFGLIDNPKYLHEFTNKIKTYSTDGIYLGDNLIATFESQNNPLSYTTINNTINQFFN